MIGFRVDVEFVWGFQCKVAGLSKSSPSFTYPPPTVILGAVAEAIAKENSIGEKDGRTLIPALSRDLLAMGLRPLNCVSIKFSDINKIISIRQARRVRYPSPQDPYGSFDAPSMGKTILTSLDDDAPTLRMLLVFDRGRVVIGDSELPINEDSFWRIHRVGSKESRVAVMDVSKFSPQRFAGIAETVYSYPLLDGLRVESLIEPAWVIEDFINPFKLSNYDESDNPVRNYVEARNITRFNLPLLKTAGSPPRCLVNAEEPTACYRVADEVIVGVWHPQP